MKFTRIFTEDKLDVYKNLKFKDFYKNYKNYMNLINYNDFIDSI